MAGCGVAHGLDLPVATGGFQDWAQIVAKAVTYGGKDQEQSLQALQSFHTLVMTKFHKQVRREGSLAALNGNMIQIMLTSSKDPCRLNDLHVYIQTAARCRGK